MGILQGFAKHNAPLQRVQRWSSAAAAPCPAPNTLWNARLAAQGTYLVLSESMVWKSFSSSSSLSVPSEKKAWNSSRDSFPSSANSNTAKWGGQGWTSTVIYWFKDSHQNYLQVLLQSWPSAPAELTGPRVGPCSSGWPRGRWGCSWIWMHWPLIGLLTQRMAQTQRGETGELRPKTELHLGNCGGFDYPMFKWHWTLIKGHLLERKRPGAGIMTDPAESFAISIQLHPLQHSPSPCSGQEC